MIAAIAALLACQLLGEVLVRALALPLPGPVAGMGLMFGYLALRRQNAPGEDSVPPAIGAVADVLLRNLSLLFIPAAVGIVQYFGVLWRFGWTILMAVAISTTAALLSTVITFRLGARLQTHWRRRGHPAARRGEPAEAARASGHHTAVAVDAITPVDTGTGDREP